MGVIDSVALDAGTAKVAVAGQTFNLSAGEASEFAVGDYVVAGAEDVAAQAILYHVGLPYVAGVSAVRIKAPVDSVDLAIGQLNVGTLTVDYTAHLAVDPTISPTAGQSIEAVGVQPTVGGVLLVGSSGGGLAISSAQDSADRQ